MRSKGKPMKVGMWPPIERAALKLREKITGVDERTREARRKARQASVDAKALHNEVSGVHAGPVAKIIHKAKSFSMLHKQDGAESVPKSAELSDNAALEADRKRSRWWPDWNQKTHKGSLDLSDDDEKARQERTQRALQAFDKQTPIKSKPYWGIDRTVRYPPRPWPMPSSSGPVGHHAHGDIFYHPDMKRDDPLEKFFYVNSFGLLTPLLKDDNGRPIRSTTRSGDSSTASNWGEMLESVVSNVGRTVIKVSQSAVRMTFCVLVLTVCRLQVVASSLKQMPWTIQVTTR